MFMQVDIYYYYYYFCHSFKLDFCGVTFAFIIFLQALRKSFIIVQDIRHNFYHKLCVISMLSRCIRFIWSFNECQKTFVHPIARSIVLNGDYAENQFKAQNVFYIAIRIFIAGAAAVPVAVAVVVAVPSQEHTRNLNPSQSPNLRSAAAHVPNLSE